MVWTTVPAFRTSIFTLDPTSPEDVQVIRGVEPCVQDSPPFGDVTVMDPAVDRVSTGVGVGVLVGVGIGAGVGVCEIGIWLITFFL